MSASGRLLADGRGEVGGVPFGGAASEWNWNLRFVDSEFRESDANFNAEFDDFLCLRGKRLSRPPESQMGEEGASFNPISYLEYGEGGGGGDYDWFQGGNVIMESASSFPGLLDLLNGILLESVKWTVTTVSKRGSVQNILNKVANNWIQSHYPSTTLCQVYCLVRRDAIDGKSSNKLMVKFVSIGILTL